MDFRFHNPGVPQFTATGTLSNTGPNKFVTIPHGNCEVTIELDHDNRFVRVVEIRAQRSFLSVDQYVGAARHIDVDRFYQE